VRSSGNAVVVVSLACAIAQTVPVLVNSPWLIVAGYPTSTLAFLLTPAFGLAHRLICAVAAFTGLAQWKWFARHVCTTDITDFCELLQRRVFKRGLFVRTGRTGVELRGRFGTRGFCCVAARSSRSWFEARHWLGRSSTRTRRRLLRAWRV
jgi:hypothetical protein